MTPRSPIPETVLARIWEEQRFRPNRVKTVDGREVSVIRRGRKNLDNGPDFKDALLRIGDHLVSGDIELHLHINDWEAHGHHTDPSYNQTVLHVVLWPPSAPNCSAGAMQIYTCQGKTIPTTIVLSALSAPIETLQADFCRADARTQEKRARCQQRLQGVPPEQILERLRALGLGRLRQRAQHVRHQVEEHGSFEQSMYEALCAGLGYSSNQSPFRELARRLPFAEIMRHLPNAAASSAAQRALWIQAVLFGTAGLLPACDDRTTPLLSSKGAMDSATRDYLNELRSLWTMLSSCLDVRPMVPEAWHFFRLRPVNFPTRRLAALSYLLLHYANQPVIDGYLRLFRLFARYPDKSAERARFLERTLDIAAQGYWKGRYLFGEATFTAHDMRFLGISRIREMLISAVFPVMLAYAWQTSSRDIHAQIFAWYLTFPAPDWNRVTKTVFAQLFPEKKRSRRRYSACISQGMVFLYKHYCALPACAQCPLQQEQKMFDDICTFSK